MTAARLFQLVSSPGNQGAAALGSSVDASQMDVIFIEGFTAQTIIGIFQDELHAAQPVRIDVAAGVPRARACDTDRIADTIDYGKVREALLELLATHKVQLLEALAELIADMLLQRFGAHWARIVLVKPHKFPDVQSVGVVIERRREQNNNTAAQLALIDFDSVIE